MRGWSRNRRSRPTPRICPLCFDSITDETKFIKYCPVCRNWEVVPRQGKEQSVRALQESRLQSERHSCPAALSGPRKLPPLETLLILNLNDGGKNRVQSLGETFALRWIDVSAAGGRSAQRDVKHWTLPIIHGARKTWLRSRPCGSHLNCFGCFQAARASECNSGDRPTSGKASCVPSPSTLIAFPATFKLENFVYASPYIATDMNAPEEQRQPFRFFANALQAIQSLRDWQPLDMPATGPAEALIRAGFYSKIVKRERRAFGVLRPWPASSFRKARAKSSRSMPRTPTASTY